MRSYRTYILASKPRGTLYIGVTNGLIQRIEQHRSGTGSAFTHKYKVHTLVWYEEFASARDAIQREKSLKHYNRADQPDRTHQPALGGPVSHAARCRACPSTRPSADPPDPRPKAQDHGCVRGDRRHMSSPAHRRIAFILDIAVDRPDKLGVRMSHNYTFALFTARRDQSRQ